MTMNDPEQYHIHFRGQVQGVGFRPLVYQLAQESGWLGWVSNGKDGVHLYLQGSRSEVDHRVKAIQSQLPHYARVLETIITPVQDMSFHSFHIRESEEEADADLILAPDRGICPSCRKEMMTTGERRWGYAFTTCLHCGPRYSITRALPYDRERTTMADLRMCPACKAEYLDPADQRSYSQTNSCPNCAIQLTEEAMTPGTQHVSPDQIIQHAATALEAGQILAVKGIGGYLLMADARNSAAIQTLRQRKHRPDKPLAVMYPHAAMLEKDVNLSLYAQEILESPEAPILLLPLREHPASGIATDDIAPALDQIGVMLPYTPLFVEILRAFPHPIISTSGNVSGLPILITEADAQSGLGDIADHFIHNDREIVVPQDDSVMRLLTTSDAPLVLRRSRGLAPAYIHKAFDHWDQEVVALGAHMKGALAIQRKGYTHISQFLGSLDAYESQERYKQVADHMLSILEASPKVILTDRHPDYFTTRWGEMLAQTYGIEHRAYAHHLAHFASVLAEHQLLDDPRPILGVIWDGAGLGYDQSIWGGEFFLRKGTDYIRHAHISPFPLLLGDKMAREPRLAALALSSTCSLEEVTRNYFSDQEWRLYTQIIGSETEIMTSSVGRLFDGVSALLGLCLRQSFEGQAAMLLETEASRAPDTLPYPLAYSTKGPIDWTPLIRSILADKARGRKTSEIAAAFHASLVDMIGQVARATQAECIAMSGGVWQNALLTQMVESQLGREFTILRHRQLSPNDENIPLGQLALLWQEEHGLYFPNVYSSKAIPSII